MTDNDNNVIETIEELQYPMVHHVNTKAVAKEERPQCRTVETSTWFAPAMLGSRVARLEDHTNTRKGPAASENPKYKTQNLTTQECIRAWWRVTRKMSIVLDVFPLRELRDARDRGTTIQSNLRTPAGRTEEHLGLGIQTAGSHERGFTTARLWGKW